MEKQKLNFNAKDSGIAFSAMVVLYLLITLLGQTILLAVTEENSALFVGVCSLFSQIAITIVICYFARGRNVCLKELCGNGKINYKSIIASVLLAFGMMFTFGIVNTLFANALEDIGIKVNSIKIPLDNFGLFILFFITFALLPAITEELFFRGLIAKGLSGAKFISVCLITAFTFALYHGSFAQLIYQFIYGAMLFVLYKAFGSIIPCMLAHFLNNFVVLFLEYLKINVNLANPILIISGVLSLAIFIMLCKNRIKNVKDEQKSQGVIKTFWLPFGLFGACVCAVLMISVFF